jgi:succinate dehydrogenase / fumarate reductase flavoprotein subunit
MRIYPAPHYTMGGLWVDYNLESTIPGLHVAGEANFSDHGANRLGACALMQGLAVGYFVIPSTVGHFVGSHKLGEVDTGHDAFEEAAAAVDDRTRELLSVDGSRTVDEFHRELGRVVWEYCGMARSAEGLRTALQKIPALREEYWADVRVPGSAETLNQSIEKAGRVADFMEFAELMCRDALQRDESCGAHYRVEHTTDEGEAQRNDAEFSYASVWEWTGDPGRPELHREPLSFEHVPPSQRSYK